LAAERHAKKIPHIGALHDVRCSRQIMKELSVLANGKGGRARAENLSARRLSEIGRMGAAARWARFRERCQRANGSAAQPQTGNRDT
jgi:hypothetical protein